jgi:hypothetical protein
MITILAIDQINASNSWNQIVGQVSVLLLILLLLQCHNILRQ